MILGFELVTRGLELVTPHEFELVTRGFELVTRGFEIVIRNSCFAFPTLMSTARKPKKFSL